jgi:endonuclease G
MKKFILFSCLLLTLAVNLSADVVRIQYTAFTAYFDSDLGESRYTVYTLTPKMAQTALDSRDNRSGMVFRSDPKVNGSFPGTVYAGSGYDAGHLTPADDMSFNAQALRESFYTTNVAPQKAALNRGSWKAAEIAIRKQAAAGKTYTVITGVIIMSPSPNRIGNHGPVIPDLFYKIAIPEDGSAPQSWIGINQ